MKRWRWWGDVDFQSELSQLGDKWQLLFLCSVSVCYFLCPFADCPWQEMIVSVCFISLSNLALSVQKSFSNLG